MFPGFPIERLQAWRDQERRDFDPTGPMPGSLTRTDAWYWYVLRVRHEQILSPTEVPFVIPDFTNREVLVQHPAEHIAGSLEGGWSSVRQPTGHGTGHTNLHPTPEGAPRLEGTVSYHDAANHEPQRLHFAFNFSVAHRIDLLVALPSKPFASARLLCCASMRGGCFFYSVHMYVLIATAWLKYDKVRAFCC